MIFTMSRKNYDFSVLLLAFFQIDGIGIFADTNL